MFTTTATPSTETSGTHVYDLRVELMEEPLGIDVASVRLSWKIRGLERQDWCRVRVGSCAGRSDIYDTGVVVTAVQMVAVPIEPEAFSERWWTVEVGTGDTASFSDAGRWETGPLTPGDWLPADWIGIERPGDASVDHRPAVPDDLFHAIYLRRRFDCASLPDRARLYVTAAGIFDVFLNGANVSESYFSPGWTDYTRRLQFEAIDVTPFLRLGNNELEIVVADGWYAGYLGWEGDREIYGKQLAALALLTMHEAERKSTVFGTDEAWVGAFGPIRLADLQNGERHDARYGGEHAVERHWRNVKCRRPAIGRLVFRQGPPIVAVSHLLPQRIDEPIPGTFVVDFGQNHSGHARLGCRLSSGQILRIRTAEILDNDGMLYTAPLCRAQCTDELIGAGRVERWEPRFTYRGYRYLEVTGAAEPPHDVSSTVLQSDMHQVGQFHCSHRLLNALHNNLVWTIRSNFLDVPTGCPQRDERMAWIGDVHVALPSVYFSFDCTAFMSKWLEDIRDAQRENGAVAPTAPEFVATGEPFVDVTGTYSGAQPGWSDGAAIIPLLTYLHSGDLELLRRTFPIARRWAEFLLRKKSSDGVLRPPRGHENFEYDWLELGPPTDPHLLYSCYLWWTLASVAAGAHVLGDRKEAARFAGEARQVRRSFARAFVGSDGRLLSETQSSYAVALRLGLVPHAARQASQRRLVALVEHDGHITTGLHGTRHLLGALTDAGHADLALSLLTSESWPNPGSQIANGVTTMPERWDAYQADGSLYPNPASNSMNQFALGSCLEWLYTDLVGLRPRLDQPGYQSFDYAPAWPSGDREVKAARDGLYGRIEIHANSAGREMEAEIEVPPNSRAAVRPPARARLVEQQGTGARDLGPLVLETGKHRIVFER